MPICSISPSIEAKPPRPPVRPWPNIMPSRPAPRKPANRPPMKPGRPNKPPVGAALGAVAGRCATAPPGWPGCVMRALDRLARSARSPSTAAPHKSASRGCRSWSVDARRRRTRQVLALPRRRKARAADEIGSGAFLSSQKPSIAGEDNQGGPRPVFTGYAVNALTQAGSLYRYCIRHFKGGRHRNANGPESRPPWTGGAI